jgi:hypothetical protein
MTLKEAREKGKLPEFIKQEEHSIPCLQVLHSMLD